MTDLSNFLIIIDTLSYSEKCEFFKPRFKLDIITFCKIP